MRTTSRRSFLAFSAAAAAVAQHALLARGDDRPKVTNPRSTDGDQRHQPAWEEMFELTVGQSKADLIGKDDRVLQAAVDYVARMGGGTVRILPGTYTLRAAVQLPSSIRLIGSKDETILTRGPSERVALAADSDWYDQEVTLSQTGGLRVGDSVVFQAKNPHSQGEIVIKRRLVARSGNRFKLDDGLRENLWLSGTPTCASLFPLLTSERTSDVSIEDWCWMAIEQTLKTLTAITAAVFSCKTVTVLLSAASRHETITATD